MIMIFIIIIELMQLIEDGYKLLPTFKSIAIINRSKEFHNA